MRDKKNTSLPNDKHLSHKITLFSIQCRITMPCKRANLQQRKITGFHSIYEGQKSINEHDICKKKIQILETDWRNKVPGDKNITNY